MKQDTVGLFINRKQFQNPRLKLVTLQEPFLWNVWANFKKALVESLALSSSLTHLPHPHLYTVCDKNKRWPTLQISVSLPHRAFPIFFTEYRQTLCLSFPHTHTYTHTLSLLWSKEKQLRDPKANNGNKELHYAV